MSWKISQLSTSLMGLLRDSDGPTNAEKQLENIREEMLELMAQHLEGKAVRPPIWSKVLYAKDIQGLWYLRSDLMYFLSQHGGETVAAISVEKITLMFRGQIPAAVFASANARKRS